jgi:hypothetical protein
MQVEYLLLLKYLLLPHLLQGGVPLPVYNTCSMLMPMNLQRVKAAATKLKPAEREVIAKRQQEIVALSKAEAAKAAAEGVISAVVH